MALDSNNVATAEVATVWDEGRRPILNSSVLTAFTNSEVAQIAAVAGLKTKVIGVSLAVSAFTSSGNVILLNGTGGPAIYNLSFFSGFSSAFFSLGGLLMCQTSANTILSVKCTGTMSIGVNITYYQGP
jgi:hypothetical protein